MVAVLVHLQDPFDPHKRTVHRLARPTTVRRLVSKHKALRRHTAVFRPGGVYGRRRVREFTRPTVCLLNGVAVKRSEWKRAKVGAGDIVTFYAAPLGGGGGGSNPLMIVAVVVAAALTWYLGGIGGALVAGALGAAEGGLVAGAITAGVTALIGAGLSYAVMAVFAQPPPQAQRSIGMDTSSQNSPVYNLGIQGNTARLEQPIPEIFGRHRVFPDFVGQPYTRYVDNEQYIHMGLGIGIGEYEIDTDEVKVGDTPIDRFEEIDYVVVEPNGAHTVAIWDPRWLPSKDVASVTLEGLENTPPSPWKGPFIANPPGTVIDRFEIDLIAPRGLYQIDPATGVWSFQVFNVDVEAQEIDSDGNALGAWTAIDSIFESAQNSNPLRYTYGYNLPGAGRWHIRLQRTDAMSLGGTTANEVTWAGLRGRLTTTRRFAGMTTIGVVMKATGDLNSVTSRKFNLIVTRKLPTWDLYYDTGMGTELLPTRDPCDAIAYIARSSNGGRIADASIDLSGIYEHRDEFADAGWTFDFVFDQSLTVSEALRRVARAVVAEIVVQGGKLCLVRDVPSLAPVAMFSPRNIRQGSVELSYKAVDSTTADALICTYTDAVSWKPKDVIIAFDDSAQERPTRVTLHGITNREQARNVGWWLARQNRYRRRVVKWGTDTEGLGVLFGDPISFSHDMPRWGQTMEVLDWDEDDRILTLSDAPDFSAGGTHYLAMRDSTGHLAGPFVATAVAGQTHQIEVGAGALPTIYTGGDEERTFVQFGPGESYARQLKVKQVSIRSEEEAEIIAFDDDPRMYEDIPADDEGDGSQEDITVHVTENTSSLVLRALANASGYLGLSGQAVTIVIDSGVTATNVKRGSWPTDYGLLTLVNEGTISGSPAFDVSSGPITVNNSAGTIAAANEEAFAIKGNANITWDGDQGTIIGTIA